MKITWKFWIKVFGIVACTVTFIIFAVLIYINDTNALRMDAFFRDICYSFRGEKYGFWYWFFRILTEFGNLYFVGIIVIIIFFLTKCDFRFILLTMGLLFAVMLNIQLKELYMRERPIEEMRWMFEESTSFPSGHSTAAAFLYSFIMYLTFHTNMSKGKKIIINVSCISLIFIVMLSRMVLGVHYLSDVIAGACVGVMVSCFMMTLYKMCDKYDILKEGIIDRVKNYRE